MKKLLLALWVLSSLGFSESPNVNILWVVDNSPSMNPRIAAIKELLPRFFETLKKGGVAHYKMAVTDTDFFTSGGKLKVNSNGIKIVTDKLQNPPAEFRGLLDQVTDSSTSFWEQGLESAFQAIEGDAKALLTPGESFSVIYISDEDDYSCHSECWGAEPEHTDHWVAFPLERYIGQLKEFASKQIRVQVYPVTGLIGGSCEVSSLGVRYIQVRSQVGGTAVSICPKDLEGSFSIIANAIPLPTPNPGIVIHADPVVLPAAMEKTFYRANLAAFVSGSESLQFSKVSGPSWLASSFDGTVQGIPDRPSIGKNHFVWRVCGESGLCKEFGVEIEVRKANEPPVWKLNPIDIGVMNPKQPWVFDLSPYLMDPDGDSLTCRAISIPPWVKVSGCMLMGTATASDVGLFNFEVEVSDGVSSSSGIVYGKVLPGE